MLGVKLSNGRRNLHWQARVRCAGVVIATMLLTACGSGNPEANVARNVVDQFYQARIQKDDVKAAQFYLSKHTPAESKDYLDQLSKAFGQVKSYHIKREEVNTVLRGRFYIYDVQVEYDPAGVASETVTVFNEVGSKETAIAAHNVSLGKVALTF